MVVALSFFIVVLFKSDDGLCAGKSLEYIYIDSSVDEAAGGHVALGLGGTVFHYQYYPEGYFLLVKEEWDEFRYQYNDLQNRSLAIASIPVSAEAYEKISTQFLTRYLLQQKRFGYLEQLNLEEMFYQAMSTGNGAVSVPGLGFFSADLKDDVLANSLKDFIEKRRGRGYLKSLLRTTEKQLQTAREHLQPELLQDPVLNLYLPTLFPERKSQQYVELFILHQAISTLLDCPPVLPRMLLKASAEIGNLSSAELATLRRYQEHLSVSILSLLESSRPGRGRAILLQSARYQAMSRSIEEGVLVTLDPFSANAELVSVDELMSVDISVQDDGAVDTAILISDKQASAGSQRTYFDQLRHEMLRDAQGGKNYFFSSTENDAIALSKLETSLGRLWEIDQAQKSRIMRREEGNHLPAKSRQVRDSYCPERQEIDRFIDISRTSRQRLESQLLQVYSYDVVIKNCVTELFATVYSALQAKAQVEHELGGYLEPGDYFSFIPFQSFRQVQRVFPVSSIEILPSFRKRQLAERYQQQGPHALLTESNTITSTIYSPWEQDSVFLFFTDDVLWLRPVYGVSNIVYAGVGALGGILSLPIDRGSLLRRSVRGIFFSLPEIGFMNIRKGTFPAVAYE